MLFHTGITIDTFVDLRKSLEKRLDDTTEKCFICGIEKNTFNRTLDRNAFRNHIKYDQCLWSYIYFIIYIWEQSKDDDDGLESYVRRCIDQSDLIWFPMNKAVRLAEHLKKGDVHSLKYKFRKDIEAAEQHINMKMAVFKDQLSRSINRVEKAIDFEPELDKKGRTVLNTRRGGAGGRNSFSRTMKASTMSKILDENFETPKSTPSDAVTPFEDPDAVTPFVNPLGADQLGQLHVKLVSISGIVVDPEHLNRLSVRVRTDMQTAFVDPLPLSVEDGSSYIRKDESADHSSGGKASRKSATHNFSTRRDCDINQSLLRFDVVGTSPILVHQGSLPSADLSNLVVKIQLLYGIGEYRRFIGGLNISLVDLLSRSDAGGIMEAEFAISRFEIIERGDKEMSLRDLDVNGSGNFIEENPNCIATVSCIASPKILEEWAEVSKFWSNYKK